ncbi:hypothetical protein PCLA_11r0315 [Pseudomonas citronellolis]|nr:hypothetical protein PCLA_11r0315 [Pseudomonas citronellolis]
MDEHWGSPLSAPVRIHGGGLRRAVIVLVLPVRPVQLMPMCRRWQERMRRWGDEWFWGVAFE